MAAITAPFGILPVLAYAIASLLLIYLGLRLARYFKSRQSSALPKPVSGGASSKSLTLLGGARSTTSSWRQWSQSLPLPALPRVRVPWVRIPSLSESTVDDVGVAGMVAPQMKTKNGKNLAIELLPTTGLPPPPSSAPIFSPTPTRASTLALQQPQSHANQVHPHHHQQLIDISSPPSTPGLTAASTSASGASFLGSPRTPSPPHFVPHGQGYPPKAVYTPQPAIHTPGPRSLHSPPYHARTPSPHALLATTSPVKQKRSRSLGGVPVRRLSSGAGSSLRNAMELEDGAMEMSLLGKKALGGKGEEQLLIDFSTSGSGPGSGEASDELDDPFVSPAASDIGVLSLNSTSQPSSSTLYTAYASSGPYAHSGYKVASHVTPAAATAAMMATPVLPSLRVDARQVGRHVPLVDLSDSETPINEKARVPTSSFDEDGWKWFGASSGTGRTSAAAVVLKTPTLKRNVGREQEKEKLVDIDDDAPELVSDARAQTVAATTAGGREVPHQHEKETRREMTLVEIDTSDEKEGMLIDVGFDDEDEERWARQTYSPHVLQSKEQEHLDAPEKDNAHSNDIHLNEPSNDLDKPIHDGAHDITPEIKDDVSVRLPSPIALVAPSSPALEAEPIADAVAFAPSLSVGGSPEKVPTDAAWAWDDPWSGHLISPDARRADFTQNADLIELDLETRMEMMMVEGEEEVAHPAESEAHHVSDAQEAHEEEAIVEHSPAGLLKATVLDEDDENESVPAFDLESLDLEAFVPFEVPEEIVAGEDESVGQSVAPVIAKQEPPAQDDEEDITPTPTPASSHAELSPAALPEITLVDVEARQAFDRPAEVFYPDPELMQLDDAWMSSNVDSVLSEKAVIEQQEEEFFPDPDLLPLPLASEAEAETVQDTLEEVRSQLLAIADKGRPSTPTLSQTPTPPASPPPLHPINTTSTANAFRLRPGKSRGASRVPSPTGTVSNAMAFPVMSARAAEDKENAALTPTTFAQQQRPAWSLRAAGAPALGLPSSGGAMGASPRTRRKALEDVNWGLGEEKDVVLVEEKKEEAEIEAVNVLEHPQNNESVEKKTHDEKEEETEKDILAADLVAPGLEQSTSLPGAFPDASPLAIVISPPAASSSTSTISFPSTSPSKESTPSTPTSTSTVAQRLRRVSLSAGAWTMPSARTLVRSPLDIALAMQMRPGLGAGADPAWMVRFLMAVYGWLLVSVAGGDF